jgi:hypothetical protein
MNYTLSDELQAEFEDMLGDDYPTVESAIKGMIKLNDYLTERNKILTDRMKIVRVENV